MLADLHCHSVYSDGFNPVAELADFAARAGLTHLALSDHDTMAGVQPLRQEAGKRGLSVIPAVECTCVDTPRGRPVHMLCYAPKRPEALQSILQGTLERRRAAKLAMAERIARLYPLTVEDVLRASAQSASIYEVHLIAPLAAMGYTKTVSGSLLQELIGPKGSCYVPIRYPDVREILAAIREADGLAVLAHPGQFDSLALAQECAQSGLIQGIECYHPRNSEAVTAQSLQLCREYGLLVTGGTDFHGMYSSAPHPLGTCTITGETLQRFLAAVGPL
ncbi:MAG TPA: PHP domain-containing protein [Candidatus Limiplasma sp.]|nr:PHP domain-containing protein [Candidatus Limiplasma sp.]HPS81971.1 PHP domain-containing protein [Candidatus Limiplasma sp.]